MQAAGASNLIPLDGGGAVSRVEVDGDASSRARAAAVLRRRHRALPPGAWRARWFAGAASPRRRPETRSGVAVVNVGMARSAFRRRATARVAAAIGGRIAWPGPRIWAARPGGAPLPAARPAERREWLTVIGVVPDVMIEEVGEREVTPAAFLPYAYQADAEHRPAGAGVSGDATALTPADPRRHPPVRSGLPVFSASSMDEMRRMGFWQYALFGQMFGVFGVLALALALVGRLRRAVVQRRAADAGVRRPHGARRRAAAMCAA